MASAGLAAFVRTQIARARALGWPESALLASVLVWIAAWLRPKFLHVWSAGWIEWDARAMGLAAWRFHGTGLFPRDLGADLASAMCPPGWKLLYWIGTLFTDPYQVSRLLPFGLVAFVAWQVFACARARGGPVVAAATLFLVLRCPFLWDRICGANPRAFGLPLVIAFLRYALERRGRATAAVLLAQAAFYPSVLMVCAPAFALLCVRDAWRDRSIRPLVLLAICGVACAALVAPTVLFVDPRIGPAITIEQLAHLEQRSIWSLYPLPPHRWIFTRAYYLPLQDDAPGPLTTVPVGHAIDFAIGVLAAIVFSVAALRRKLPFALYATAACSIAAYFAACAVAYRLYVPDRLLHYVSVPIILLFFVPLTAELLTLLKVLRAPLLASVLVVAATVVASGDGLAVIHELRDFRPRNDKSFDFIAKLPRDVLIAAHPARSSDIEVFGQRSVLFSGISNAPNFATYGLTVERRISEFYTAYYAADLSTVRRFVANQHLDYLVVDQRDFGPKAYERAAYVEPWTLQAQGLLDKTPAASMVLANPPANAIVFQDGPVCVLDAHAL